MLIIQFLLMAGALGLTVYFFTRRTAEVSALVTLAFVGFLLLAIYGMLRPHQVNDLANDLDVGRGADLLLYGLVCAFATSTVAIYFRFQDVGQDYTRLARAVALDRAHRDNEPLIRAVAAEESAGGDARLDSGGGARA